MHTSHYSRMEKPTIPLGTQERLPRTRYILHVVSITTHTHDRRQSIGENKEKKKDKGGERKEMKAKQKTKKVRKEKKRQKKQEKTRQEEEARKGKGKKRKKCHTSRP